MKILAIGSKVTEVGVSFTGSFDKHFSQVFKVENVSQLSGWKTHALCTHMFAVSSHKLGVFW